MAGTDNSTTGNSSLNAQVLSSRALTLGLPQPYIYKGYTLVSPLIAPLSFRQRCQGLFYSVKINLSCLFLHISQMKFDIKRLQTVSLQP